MIAGVLLVLLGGVAGAEAPTREEYVERLEAICKPGALETQRVMKGARADVRAERLKAATAKFEKATKIFGLTIKQISPVPRPSADVTRLRKWFGYLKQQEAYMGDITQQLRLDHPIKAQKLVGRFIDTGNRANDVVLPFGFNHCSFKFSRYG